MPRLADNYNSLPSQTGLRENNFLNDGVTYTTGGIGVAFGNSIN
jgi:hypothetical protein